MHKFKFFWLAGICLVVLVNAACREQAETLSSSEKLRQWRTGVWISGQGTYTVYTDDHYFVLSFEGDTSNPNIYCAASQLSFHQMGMARRQVVRLRQFPGRDITAWKESIFTAAHSETPVEIDTTLFTPGTCTIRDGVIYDVILEETDEYVLLATCDGDREKIYNDGRSVYLPASGGEFWSYRVEKLM